MKSISSLSSLLLVVKEIIEAGGEIIDVGRSIWEQFNKSYESDYSDENPTTLSKALHRMHTGSSPKIALVGMTSAGKSSLVNALFGESIADVKRTSDTTDCIIQAKFPSGLVIYDTPGLCGDEELGYENITRLFLGLPQEEDSKIFSSVRYQSKSNKIIEVSEDSLSQSQQLDAIIIVVDISRTLNKNDKKPLRNFYLEIQKKFNGRIVVCGTHYNELMKLSTEEIQGQINSYNKVFENQLIPISSTSGEGLSELVFNLFRTMPEKVSPAKLQESLVKTQKLSRLSFVITEISSILAELILLNGNQSKDINAGYLWILALICNHYSVDENTWLKCNGNALKIGEMARESGTQRFTSRRSPKNFIELLTSIFNGGIYTEKIVFKTIGISGLKVLLPGIYELLYELNEYSSLEFLERDIKDRIDDQQTHLEKLISQQNSEELTSHISVLIAGLFPDCT